ncbi:hypothetical protein OS187_11095 [Xanthomonadaceae bacterium JHOS43]|nr:hypothetical protein [Xanthomonadaceae bacterium JHOS43]
MPALRRRWIVLPLMGVLAFSAFLALRAFLQPERISTFLLQRAQQATGLDLQLDAPADIGLWPDLHVELAGLVAREPSATTPLLRVTRVEVALPWSMLGGEDITLLGLRLVEPHLDLPAAMAWLESTDEGGPPAPLRLPKLDAPLEIIDGRITAEGWSLDRLDIDLPAFIEGARARLSVRGTLQRNSTSQLFALQLETVPRADGPVLRLEPATLDLVLDAFPAWRPHVEGSVSWSPAGLLAFELRSLIAPWPDAWPPLPLPPADDDGVSLMLRYTGDTDLTGPLTFAISRGDDGARGTLMLNQTLPWLGRDSTTPLPPLDGVVEIPRLQYGSIDATGIRISTHSRDADD